MRKILLLTFLMSVTASAQTLTWREVSRDTSLSFLTSATAMSVADSVVHYQLPCGGWMKNQDWAQGVKLAEWQKACDAGIGATIDNGATYTEMRYLARILAANVSCSMFNGSCSTYQQSFLSGLRYLLRMQYANGGFPQFFPYEGAASYSRHITFNDDAMVSVLRLLYDIAQQRPPFNSVPLPDTLRVAVKDAFERGLQCLLDCQIRKDGQLTVWCQQHHYETLQPVGARSYELPSFCGNGETVGILRFLMDLETPSAAVCQAVHAGIAWLWAHRIEGYTLERFTNADGKNDQRVVAVEEGSEGVLLARYYDLETEQPFFCDRDGIPHPHLSDIGYERRNGYAWIRPFPLDLLRKYEMWKERHQ